MKIWYSQYQLYPQFLGVNKSKNKFRNGALIRICFDDGAVGFSDLCPHTEMGDRPIDFELRQITISKPTTLGEQAIYHARLDATARTQKKALYLPEIKIKNHFLITDLDSFDLERIEKLESSGFSEFKIKLGKDLQNETALVERLVNRLSARARVRLDFNGSLSRDRFVDWFEKNQKWLRPFLEFIEDPFAYNANEWRDVASKWNITLALDLAADPVETEAIGAQVVIIKPAIQNAHKVIQALKDKNKKFVFTHYMDFPVGQMFALVTAQALFAALGDKLLTCGLQHHDLYQGITFQEAIKSDGPFIIPPEGFGVGFDKLLNNQTWTELV